MCSGCNTLNSPKLMLFSIFKAGQVKLINEEKKKEKEKIGGKGIKYI